LHQVREVLTVSNVVSKALEKLVIHGDVGMLEHTDKELFVAVLAYVRKRDGVAKSK
jgi:hypothetical protein